MALILWVVAALMVLQGLKRAIADGEIGIGFLWIVAACLVGPGGVSIFGVH